MWLLWFMFFVVHSNLVRAIPPTTSTTPPPTTPPAIQDYRIAECTSKNIQTINYFLFGNEETFIFQSLNFPQKIPNEILLGDVDYIVCFKALFVKNNSIATNIWLAVTNGFVENLLIENQLGNYLLNSDIFIVSSTTSFVWESYNQTFSANYWTAFQSIASAYSPDKKHLCPLSMKSFNLEANPGLIIPITPRYDNLTNATDSCNWNFTINSQHQKLKVVIKKLILPYSFNLSLNADGKVVKIFNDTVNALPISYYFNGSNFDFAFTNLHLSNFSNFELFLLISAVERSPIITNSGCEMTKNGAITIFSNLDYIQGYPSNQKCEFDIEISPNVQSLLVIFQYQFESCCDILSITHGTKNESQIIEWDDSKPMEYLITDKIDNGKLVFESDGNTQQAGFIATLTEYNCTCAKNIFIVSCENEIIVYPLPNNNKYYCDMMNCTYKILPNPECPNISVSITPNLSIRPSVDKLILKNQGKVIGEYQNGQAFDWHKMEYIFQKIFSSDSSNIFYYSSVSNLSVNFVSKNSSVVKLKQNNWWVSIKPILDYSVTTQFLSKTNVTKSVLILNQMSQRSTYTVCAKDYGTTLDIYMTISQNSTNLLSSFLLYDSNILSDFVGSLDSLSPNIIASSKTLPHQITSTSGCFSVFSLLKNFALDVLLFQLNELSNQSPNVIQPSFESNNNFSEISISSKNGESSETIFMVPFSANLLPFIWISNISVLESSNATLAFECTGNGRQLITVNDGNVMQWNFFQCFNLSES